MPFLTLSFQFGSFSVLFIFCYFGEIVGCWEVRKPFLLDTFTFILLPHFPFFEPGNSRYFTKGAEGGGKETIAAVFWFWCIVIYLFSCCRRVYVLLVFCGTFERKQGSKMRSKSFRFWTWKLQSIYRNGATGSDRWLKFSFKCLSYWHTYLVLISHLQRLQFH